MKKIILPLVCVATLMFISQSNTVNAEFSSVENYAISQSSDITKPINKWFKDPNLAQKVAENLNKNSSNLVSQSELDTITILSASRANIQNLNGIENLNNLQTLIMYDNFISNLGPLKNLNQLRSLDLNDNFISNLGPLRNLNQLRSLDLNGNSISNLGPLKNLNQLRSLDLNGNSISNLGPLKNLNQLDYLELENNNISDIRPLQHLSSLLLVKLRDNYIKEIPRNLAYCGSTQNRTDFEIDFNKLDNIQSVFEMAKFKSKVNPYNLMMFATSVPYEQNADRWIDRYQKDNPTEDFWVNRDDAGKNMVNILLSEQLGN